MDLTQVERTDELVRQLSREEDPNRIIRVFAGFGHHTVRRDGVVSLSRRGLTPPRYRITRYTRWKQAINPWDRPDLLPEFDRGLLGELIYAGRPVVVAPIRLVADDPAREYLESFNSMACVPTYDAGEPLNMVCLLRSAGAPFTSSELESLLLNANLIGKAVKNAILAEEVRAAYQQLDREMQRVGEMQRQLLPTTLPTIEGLQLGADYVTCSQAGGDYYDIFRLDERRWGICVGDVSGHGTPAAVVMAMLHTLVHTFPAASHTPSEILSHVNRHMLSVVPEGMFATAIYGVYDAPTRTLRYANAGHPVPRCRRDGKVISLAPPDGLPLGVSPTESWDEQQFVLQPDDVLLLFTDGLVEGTNPGGEQFGAARLERALAAAPANVSGIVEYLDRQYQSFCDGATAMDDRTLLVGLATE